MRIPLIVLTAAARAAGHDAASEVKPSTKPMVDYPETHQIAVVDEYCGTSITGPYRWLEDDYSNVTKAWMDVQNAVTFCYLKELPRRQESRDRLWRLLD